MTFHELNLDPRLLDGIDAMNFKQATPVQEQVMPLILEGRDVIASAQTGTGKTAAFLLPLLNQLITHPHDSHEINALVIVPTRELAIQIAQALEGLSYFTSVSGIAVYGGGDGKLFEQEKRALQQGADIVICTPGRMISHLNLGYVKLKGLKYLVLDEADRMLDMGFHADILKIIGYLPKERQTLLFSATMPSKMRDLARTILKNPAEINIAISRPPEKIKQSAFVVYEAQKLPLLKYLLGEKEFKSVVIFCSKKENVKQLNRELQRAKFSIAEIHSDLEQSEREQVLMNFKNKKLNFLVATDILSRGIDIEDIDLVVNYDVPNDGEDYVHRIGRTARAQSDGTAYTFISEREHGKFGTIETLLGNPVPKGELPAFLGKGPEYQPKKRMSGSGRPGPRRPDRPSGGPRLEGGRGRTDRPRGPRK
ncbi:MAG: DEAD/DEAH box helicase [Flavobacteriaceae bacterium]|nr:DEAD/DEAH box helicase [Flavobacteriaceae bacterium]